MEMKPITQKEVLKNRFIRIYKNEYGEKMVERKRPTWEEAQRMRIRTLCIYIGVCGLRLRPVDGRPIMPIIGWEITQKKRNFRTISL